MRFSPSIFKSPLVLAVALMLLAFAVTAPVSAQSGPLFSDGRVSGRVVDENGRPAAGVSVGVIPVDTERNAVYTDSDANGFYTLHGLEYGRYKVRFFDYQNRFVYQWYGGGLDEAQATVIEIASADVVRIDARLVVGAALGGAVTLADGRTADTADVQVRRRVDDRWVAQGIDYHLIDGRYYIGGLAAGEYIVEASDYVDGRSLLSFHPAALNRETATPIVVALGETRADVDIVLGAEQPPTGATVSGRVVGAWNRPLADMRVRLYRFRPEWSEPWRRTASTLTDGNGNYRFDNLPEAYYKVGFEDPKEQYAPEFNGDQPTLGAAPHRLLQGSDSWTADARLDVGGELVGSVITGSGAPPESMSVSLYRWNNHDAYLFVDSYYFQRSNGRFAISGLAAGNYKVQVNGYFGSYRSFGGWFSGAESQEAATPVAVALYRKTNLGVVVLNADSGTIGGVLRDAQGRPLAGARVELIAVGGFGGPGTFTALDGSYRFRDAPPGEYVLEFSDERSRFTRLFYPNADSIETAEVLTLPPNGSLTADVMVAAVGSISGRITLPTAEPIAFGSVTAYGWDGEGWQRVHRTRVARDGYYVLAGLPAGDFRLLLEASADRHYTQPRLNGLAWWPLAVDEADAETVTVVAGRVTANIDARLPRYIPPYERMDGLISGQVFADDGGTIGGVEVTLYRLVFRGKGDFWERERMTTTDGDGRYWIGQLPYGAMRLGFRDPSGVYAREYYNDRVDFDIAFQIVLNEEQPQRDGVDVGLATLPTKRMMR